MADRKSFEEMLEEIKAEGEKERETIEVAETIARIIGDLTRARIRKGLSQRQLAEATGLKQSAIARMENIQVIPRLDTLVKIARYLDVEIEVEETAVKKKMTFTIATNQVDQNMFIWNGATEIMSMRMPHSARAGGYYGTGC